MGKVIHVRKFAGGRASPEQYHSDNAFPPGATCAGCRARRPIVRAIVMAPLDELRRRDPDFDHLASLASINPAAAERFYAMLVQLRGSDGKPVPHVRMSTTYACQTCAPEMERQAARGPSWCVVEFNRGPGPGRAITSG